MSEKEDFGTFFAGLVVGGLVGAAVALLLAPQSGEETRTLIRDKSIEIKDRAVEYGQDARMRASKAMDDARMRADDAIEQLRMRGEEYVRIAREKATSIQKTYMPGAEVPVDTPEAGEGKA
jgi:gas vesicle protein